MAIQPLVREPTAEVLERKRAAFKRLAEKRTNAIMEKIRILGNLANQGAYDYSEDDVKKIFAAIEEELRIVKAKFKVTKRREFRLD